MLGLPIVDHAEDLELTAGAEANEGYVASVMGLAGWPTAAEVNAVSRDIAVLADALARRAAGPAPPDARLHGRGARTSSAGRRAAGLPVTCDVTPHHLAFTDEWIAGSRRWSWEALGRRRHARATRGRTAALTAAPVRHLAAGQPAAPHPGRRRGLPGGPARRHGRGRGHGPRPAHGRGQGSGVRQGQQRHQRHRDRAGRPARARRRRQAAAGACRRGADHRPGARPGAAGAAWPARRPPGRAA